MAMRGVGLVWRLVGRRDWHWTIVDLDMLSFGKCLKNLEGWQGRNAGINEALRIVRFFFQVFSSCWT